VRYFLSNNKRYIVEESMIGATKRLLIETLLNLALGEEIDVVGDDLSDHLRAIFLLVSSHSTEDLPHAELMSHETYEDYETGLLRHISGIAVHGSGMLLTDIVQNLRYLTEIPEEIATSTPELKFEDFQAALYAIHCIIACLQWNESTETYAKQYSPEKVKKQIAASLSCLRSYRETGEP
jgi:hypothetical protein